MDIKKIFLIIVGTISVALGILGIVLPILPTTPFLLLAAACYFRSSKRFYNWLMTNKLFGEYIKNYYEGRGIPLKTKIFAILLLWTTIISSIIFFVDFLLVKLLLCLILIGVTIHILSIKTYRNVSQSEINQ